MQKRGGRIEERRMNSTTPPDPERAAPALCEPLPPCACPTIRAAAWNGAGCRGGEGKGAESNLFTPHNVLFEQTPKEKRRRKRHSARREEEGAAGLGEMVLNGLKIYPATVGL